MRLPYAASTVLYINIAANKTTQSVSFSPSLVAHYPMKLPQDTQNCRLLPPVPQLPCNRCATFSQPPLDGSLCMSEIYEWHARHSPDHPMFQYLDDGGSTITISFKDAMYAMHRGGRLLRTAVEAAQLRSKHPIIAALSLSGAFCL